MCLQTKQVEYGQFIGAQNGVDEELPTAPTSEPQQHPLCNMYLQQQQQRIKYCALAEVCSITPTRVNELQRQRLRHSKMLWSDYGRVRHNFAQLSRKCANKVDLGSNALAEAIHQSYKCTLAHLATVVREQLTSDALTGRVDSMSFAARVHNNICIPLKHQLSTVAAVRWVLPGVV